MLSSISNKIWPALLYVFIDINTYKGNNPKGQPAGTNKGKKTQNHVY